MGLFKSKTRSIVGLDIEPGFVAAAEFSTNGSPVLVRAATTSLGPGLFHEGEVVDVDGLSDRLKAFFREHDLPKKVRLGVASQKIAVRVLDLPAIDDEQELDAAIRFQAQEELPMPLEQAVLDHRLLERIDDDQGGRMRILVVAARRDTVEHLLAAARRAGLTPELVDLSAFAMIRALHVSRGQNGMVPPVVDYTMPETPPAPLASPELEHDFTPAHVEPLEEHDFAPADVDSGADEVFAEPTGDHAAHDEDEEHDGFGGLIDGEFGDVTIADEQAGELPGESFEVELAPSQDEDDLHALEPATDFEPAAKPENDEEHAPAAFDEPEAPAGYDVPGAAGNGYGPDEHTPGIEHGAVASHEPDFDPASADPETLGTVYCYVGGLTNLAIAVGRACYFNRVLQNGLESMAATLAERRGLTIDHAREWLRHVGLERDVDRIEGEREIVEEAREVLSNAARRVADEVRLSIEYYHSTVPNAPRVEAAVLAGPGIAIAGLATLLEQELGMPVESRSMGRIEVRPGALDNVDGAHLTIATGLALDEVPA